MDFRTWEPVYETILSDFGFEREADERARDRLAELLQDDSTLDTTELHAAGCRVAIAGAADCLEGESILAENADRVFAAGNAADRLHNLGVTVDCVVTDLDKHTGTVGGFATRGTPIAVHAHGDNVHLLEEAVPGMPADRILPTTQAEPAGRVGNFGGFTDGDRAAFLADAFGAASLVFPGWEFEDSSEGDSKRRKLTWACRLLCWLERRRAERFEVLDGWRDTFDMSSIPGFEEP